MEDKKWLSFEKTGRVTDYLTYCQSSIGKYAEYETDSQGRRGNIYGADVHSDRNNSECDASGRIR